MPAKKTFQRAKISPFPQTLRVTVSKIKISIAHNTLPSPSNILVTKYNIRPNERYPHHKKRENHKKIVLIRST